MNLPRIAHVRAYVVRGGGADYHDQGEGHGIGDHIATPMARYPEYRQSRQSFGINVLGTLVVEVEATDGTVGFAVTTAGEIGAFIVERHLSRFLVGRKVTEIEKIWDQMYFSTQFYGDRKSTRLNSSHANISYAVFCLKKKKTDISNSRTFSYKPLSNGRTNGRC